MIVGRITAVLFLGGCAALAQDSATLTVTVMDPNAFVVPGAKVTLTDLRRGVVKQVETKETGFALFDFLQPGDYSLLVEKQGFDAYRVERLTLQLRDRQTFRAELKVAAAAGTSVEVTDKAAAVSNDAGQGLSMDQQYLENLPANGRSAESLVLMAPGVTSAAGGKGDAGFNANGLRSNANYYTLDGVSLNRPSSGGGGGGGGFGPGGGGPGGGGPPMAGAGGSSEMISLDAMQEMKVQTSSFAPEFGRSPGAQIVMTSRGGGNGWHGSLFFYKRSDRFDANDWFANSGGYPRGRERQDRPGGVFSGPIVRNKTFFFLSFEKLKLESPQSLIADVPDMASRQSAPAVLRPYLNAFPIPNSVNLGSGAAEYRAVLSNPSKNHSSSVRIDHVLNANTTLFARYSLTPSDSQQRGSDMATPNIFMVQSSHSQLVTTGVTHAFGGGALNDLRVNYSSSSGHGQSTMDSYGGAVPLTDSLVFPKGVSSATGSFGLNIMGFAGYSYGGHSANSQKQVNVVDNLTRAAGNHHLKAGLDIRKILQTQTRNPYSVNASFDGMTGSDYSFLAGEALNGMVSSNVGTVYPTYTNFSLYGQDTWRATDRTTVTYGLRWDVNPAPTTRKGPKPFALSNSDIAGVTQNDPLYPTRWFDVAPRFGVAYLSDDTAGREMMLRAGAGMFYDMGYGVIDGAFNGAPYSNVQTLTKVAFPLSASNLAPPALPPTRPYGQITTGGVGLKSPVIYQWNGTLEKNFGPGQMLSVGVAGTKGSNLMRMGMQPSFSGAYDVLQQLTNGASSTYNALQVQFRKRVSNSFQTQLSYTWSHSIDSSSSDFGGGGFASLFGGGDRSSSDYDIRHNINFSGSWRLPAPRDGPIFYPFRHWYLDFLAAARSGLPFDIRGVSGSTSATSSSSVGMFAQVRPSYTGKPIWISDPNVPGGRRLNRAAFSTPTGYAQGNMGRNSLRGFWFSQLDLSLRRMIPITDRFQINVAAQGYNVLNHPNFANPSPMEGGNMSSPNFGVMTRMMNQSAGGGVSSLYHSGGPRSMEFSVKLQF